MAFIVFLKYLRQCTSEENLSSTSKEECQEIVWLLKIALHQKVIRELSKTMCRAEWEPGDAETIIQQIF